MDTTTRWKLIFVAVVILAGIYFLIPTYKIYIAMSPEEFAALPQSERDDLRDGAVALGLDLQGGMDLLLEVDREAVEGDADDVMERALSVLRNRVDEFGVVEPVIQKLGQDRISVQLPGLTDEIRARNIIQRVARLEFKLVKEEEERGHILRRADQLLARFARLHATELEAGGDGGMRSRSTAPAPGTPAALIDTLLTGEEAPSPDSLLAVGDSLATEPDSLALENPLLSRYIPLPSGVAFEVDDIEEIDALMAEAGLDSVLTNAELRWGNEELNLGDGRKVRILYVLDKKIQLTGEEIKRAGVGYDPTTASPEVDLTFSTRGAAVFARVTGNNVGRQLAIVLDNKVASAPVIQGRIAGGRASISGGGMTDTDANDLKVVLEAGALPAPLRIIEERTVGPSLGRDSIRQGLRAGLIGAALVVGFMLMYYRLSGVVAVLALALNIFLLFAALAKFGATLTMPGIAGIVLTVGIAVDANVLIFERMREEMRREKTVRASVKAGFERALSAIIDSNLTTLIAAFVLLRFGTGPIKGFAVTLAIGIVANLFTAYFVSRMVFNLLTSRMRLSKLSI